MLVQYSSQEVHEYFGHREKAKIKLENFKIKAFGGSGGRGVWAAYFPFKGATLLAPGGSADWAQPVESKTKDLGG